MRSEKEGAADFGTAYLARLLLSAQFGYSFIYILVVVTTCIEDLMLLITNDDSVIVFRSCGIGTFLTTIRRYMSTYQAM
jgi:hypothetical protein